MVYPNHEVVVFQPREGTALYLGSLDKYTSYSNPPAPPVSTNFLDLFISTYPIAPPISSVLRHISPIMNPIPTSSPGMKIRPPGLLPHPPFPSASDARPCAPHRVPASAAVSRLCTNPKVVGDIFMFVKDFFKIFREKKY